MKEEKVILVNERDEPIGLMPKMEAHEKAVLHRAFSVFVFNQQGELMLQQRALHKYHSPGLWTNTCCSHQRDGESNLAAGARRLQEEMGFVTNLYDFDSFIYHVSFSNGLIEHEFDHILLGVYNGIPKINPDEVDEWKWISIDELCIDIEKNPEKYTAWFKIIINKYSES